VYRLRFSKLYHSDLDECYNYIGNKLQNPMAADRLIIETKKKLIEVRNNPTHRPLVNDEYLANLGYRLKAVKNFIIFYIIDDDNKRIQIFIRKKRLDKYIKRNIFR
jgi:plasmid stabilization system protein ParE